jgi:SAM-dependent methyltransferase
MTDAPKSVAAKSPWDWMGPEEKRLLGDIVAQPEEQARWCKAIVFGTLPYMWREKAAVVRQLAYEKLDLRPGDRVLLIGECLRVCGFVDDIRQQIGPTGEIHEVDITNEARGAYLAGRRGRSGQLATWQWRYSFDLPSGYFDSVAVMQATQHADDWRETGGDLLRVLKPGRPLLLAEITLSPQLKKKAELDIHIEAWIDKIFSRIGWSFDQTPYYSLQDLCTAFDGLVDAPETFEWKGIELFWARNKTA